MIELNDGIAENLRYLQSNETFKVYLEMIKSKFNDEYKKLRSAKPEDLSRINGKLDGIEYCLNVIDTEISQYREEKKDHNQE